MFSYIEGIKDNGRGFKFKADTCIKRWDEQNEELILYKEDRCQKLALLGRQPQLS